MNRLNMAPGLSLRFSFRCTSLAALLAATLWLLRAPSALADCDIQNPSSSQTSTCSTLGTFPVTAQTGSTNVLVTVTVTGTLNIINDHGILIFNQSQATNLGAINIVGDDFDGISSRGAANTVVNRGTITTTGDHSEGLFTSGNGGTFINDSGATITTVGGDASGINSFSVTTSDVLNNTLINRGTIVTTGNNSSGIAVFSSGNTIINEGAISTRGSTAEGVFARGANNTLLNNGSIDVSGAGTAGIGWANGPLGRIDNNGSIIARGANAQGVSLGAAGTLSNTETGHIESQQANGVLANGGGTFENAGTITGKLTGMNLFNGAATLNNSGQITGNTAQGLWFSGSFDNSVTNSGVISGAGTAVQFDTGNDHLDWQGGSLNGQVLMGGGNDTAIIANTSESILVATTVFDGGLGEDQLTFNAVTTATGARYTGWESIALLNGSRLDLNDPLILGDSGTTTGALSVDATSSITAGQGVIAPSVAGQKVALNNAGLIDLTAGGNSVGDRLTVIGDYVGTTARLNVQSVIASDGAASDQLVVSQGSLSGSTQIRVSNVGGLGALTAQNGIEVVQANQGATSSNQAFTLGNSVSAGAYEYYLFKGGVTAGSENSWFLRSSVVVPMVDAASAASAPVAAAGTPALPRVAAGSSVPLYRIEVPMYALVPATAALLTQTTLGTFHERQGEQGLLVEAGKAPTGWARTFGRDTRKSFSGTVDPRFDGTIGGFQVGNDLFTLQGNNPYTYHTGIFVAHAQMQGDVRGFALGFKNNHSGSLKFDGDSLGAYLTVVEEDGAYLDAVSMCTRLDGHTRSERGITLDLDGSAFSLSLEGGYPIRLSNAWSIEPQAQIVAQSVSLDDQHDAVSQVGFDSQEYWSGRLGVRLKGNYRVADLPVEPYLRTNVRRSFGGSDSVTFNDLDSIKTQHDSSIMDIGGGVQVRLSANISVFAAAGYSTNVDGHTQKTVEGALGIRALW
ncbi:Antigen 43 precursor [compost metagenome]